MHFLIKYVNEGWWGLWWWKRRNAKASTILCYFYLQVTLRRTKYLRWVFWSIVAFTIYLMNCLFFYHTFYAGIRISYYLATNNEKYKGYNDVHNGKISMHRNLKCLTKIYRFLNFYSKFLFEMAFKAILTLLLISDKL